MSHIATYKIMIWVVIFIIMNLTAMSIQAQEHPHPDHTYNADIGYFYTTWKSPLADPPYAGRRKISCCDWQHCSPVITFQRYDQWWARGHRAFPAEIILPANVIENNQPDPRSSPDVRSHACITLKRGERVVMCAVLEGGQ